MDTVANFTRTLEQAGHIKSQHGRSVHHAEKCLWGCDEYGCDCYLGEPTPAGLLRAYAWHLAEATHHPAETLQP